MYLEIPPGVNVGTTDLKNLIMSDSLHKNIGIGNENAAALAQRQFRYGDVSTVTAPTPSLAPGSYLSFLEHIRYLACEYFHGILFVALSLMFVLAIPAVLTKPARLKAMMARFAKRSLDIAGSVVGLLLTIPVFLIVPILIKLDSPGPVFYTQTRVGVNRRRGDRRYHQRGDIPQERRSRGRRRQDLMGKPFTVIKFRTMVNDAERKSGPVWATKNDTRITKLGRFLRKSRIDEIPQFLNVLKGDMALVGPRPERPAFVAELSTKVDRYADRLAVKPGLTGLAQVEAPYDSDIASVVRKVNLDLEYIRKRSVCYDIKIMLRTFIVVFTGRGAC